MKQSIKQYLVIFGLLLIGFTLGQCTKPCLKEQAKLLQQKAKFEALEDDYWDAVNKKSDCDQDWMRIVEQYKRLLNYYQNNCE